MPPDRDPATVLDIVIAGRRISEFVAGQNFEDFSADFKTQSAVLHQLLIIGEAAKRLRDKLIHHYEDTDLGLIWKAIERDVPELLAFLHPLLPQPES